MKAITIKQPWASLIVHGIKDIENRTWPCPKKYLGQRVLIHSSAVPVEMIILIVYLRKGNGIAFHLDSRVRLFAAMDM